MSFVNTKLVHSVVAVSCVVGSLALLSISPVTYANEMNADMVKRSISSLKSPSDYAIVSIGNDALLSMKKSDASRLAIEPLSNLSKNKDDVALIKLPNANVDALSRYMHENHRRCGGYVWHQSLEKAQTYIRQLNSNTHRLLVEYTIDNDDTVNEMLMQVVSSNLSSTVGSMGSYNNRYYTASSGVEASQWLKSHWENITFTRDDIMVELFEHAGWDQPSVIVTIVGETIPEEVVVIGGHLDSINGSSSNRETARAPGHDDNASGIAVVTETLRAMVTGGYKPARTVKIMGYAAEEVGLRGSGEIAEMFADDNIDVVGVAQFDMTGFKGTADKDIVFMTDYTNADQNQFMMDLLDHYFPQVQYGTGLCGYGCSDHASWYANGFAASMPFESNFNDYNSDIHTSNDNHFDANHATNFVNLSIAFVGELAKGNADSDNYQSQSTVEFESGNVEVIEQQTLSISIQRTGLFDREASVNYRTISGTAVAGEDFVAVEGTLNWTVNDAASKVIEVEALAVTEDKEFTIELTDASGNAVLGEVVTVNVSLLNNSTSAVSFKQSTIQVPESTASNIVIQRVGEIDMPATVRYVSVNGTAIAGINYEATSGVIEWAAGDDSDKTISIGTYKVDESETFTLELRSASGNAVIDGNDKITITIQNTPVDDTNGSSGGVFGILLTLPLLLLGWRRKRSH
ncbi:M20/M25/M40 family metallo-hydrolase [Pleionea litopenaei]|uniref:M20/M25/M40 family metallo-hydrolase n=1 Tax=Pleionea litopenaei TaxID=3070815 RepID=A0AA51RSL1_9GAMM|nr:M20/M25/M40 family metallo-hydrolase [Pleionea sp. HL-JVS1]WMS86807.1 M20/M25/M40 family metallo-hydrolase [Pleionea sp. HL-JVS1]